jgi:ELWxxDGT repeat protein
VFFTSSGRYTDGTWSAGYGEELWKTDGTPEGTVRLFQGLVHDLIGFGGTLYFAGSRPQGGYELWKSDGTPEGTVRVKDVLPDYSAVNLRLLSVVNGQLFFGVGSSFNYNDSFDLWKTDGSEAGTVKVTDVPVYVDITSMAPNALHVFAGSGNYLYFRRHTGGDVRGGELWRTDGTSAGTGRVGTAYDPRELIDVGGALYFVASNPGSFSGETLYRVAPGASAPAGVRTFHGGDYRLVSGLTKVGDRLFFSAPSTTSQSMALWKSDGTAAGTTVVRTVPNSALEPSSPRVLYVTDVDGTAYFVMSETDPEGMDGIVGGLWKSDGTSAGTVKVRDFAAPVYSSPLVFMSAGGKLVYSDGKYLWRSDGTTAGTVQITRLHDDTPPSTEFGWIFGGPAAVAVGDQVYFSASVPGGGRDLRVASLTPPEAPSGLTVSGGSSGAAPAALGAGVAGAAPAAGGVVLNWADNSANETAFAIERSRTADFAALDAVYFVGAGVTQFTDTTAAPGVAYFYRVRAVNAGGGSNYSNRAGNVSAVVARHVFFNHSAFDGNDGAATAADDNAIAIGKAPLVGGAAPSVANVTSYSRGINGIMVDLLGLRGDVGADDFSFRVRSPGGTWSAAPQPLSITRRNNAGVGGSDRITIVWADGAIINQWLEVTVKPNARTGLATGDVFYFGNLVGDAGDSPTNLRVNALDLGAIKRALNTNATLASSLDVNRDGRINALDLGIVKANLNRSLPVLTAPPVSGFSSGPLDSTGDVLDELLRG